jgi:hypothetical protein
MPDVATQKVAQPRVFRLCSENFIVKLKEVYRKTRAALNANPTFVALGEIDFWQEKSF